MPSPDYQTIRLSVWAISDALQAAASIAARAADAHDDTDLCVAFDNVRKAIMELRDHDPTMLCVRSAMHEARAELTNT